MKKILCATVLAALAFGAEGLKVIGKYKVGGEGRWDYVTVDSNARRENQQRRPNQPVEDHEAEQRMDWETDRRKSENVHPVPLEIPRLGAEMNPPEDQRESNRRR